MATTEGLDAIALLSEDHREVEQLFADFEAADNANRKRSLAGRICTALKIHTRLEEEIFYPACREADVDPDLMDEAEVEHDGAMRLIAQIEGGKPSDDQWEAKVKVLSEQIEHHVKEEEQRGGLFSQARAAGLDLDALGAKMTERKRKLSKS